jgi:protein TonB
MARNPLLQSVQTQGRSKSAWRKLLSFFASAFLQVGIFAGLTLASIVAVRALPELPDTAFIAPRSWIPVVPPSGKATPRETPVRKTASSLSEALLDNPFIVPATIPTEIDDDGWLDFDAGSVGTGVDVPGIDGGVSWGAPPMQPEPNRETPEPAPVRVGGDIRAPQKTVHVDPVYPKIAIQGRIEGFVILETIIDASGNVQGLRILRSVPLLDKAAMAAVRQWKYEPTRLNGQPVPIVMTVTVRFVLDR